MNYDPYYTAKVMMNDRAMEIVETSYSQTNHTLKYIVIKCDSNCKGQNQFTLTVQNLQNQFFITKSNSNKILLSILELYSSGDEYVSKGSFDLNSVLLKKLVLSSIINQQIFISNPNPGQ